MSDYVNTAKDVLSNFNKEFVNQHISIEPIGRYVVDSMMKGKTPYEMIEFLLNDRKRLEKISSTLIENYSTKGNWKSIQDKISQINDYYQEENNNLNMYHENLSKRG